MLTFPYQLSLALQSMFCRTPSSKSHPGEVDNSWAKVAERVLKRRIEIGLKAAGDFPSYREKPCPLTV